MRRAALALTVSLALAAPAQADVAQDVGARGCAVLAGRVAGFPGAQPVLLRSYDGAEGRGALAEPALRDAAFTYDNALAAIALLACGKQAEARRVGDALVLAATRDRAGPRGRLRNAYRAGLVAEPLPPGWWNDKAGRWEEDAYQVGTATGNVAWAALALLALHQETGEARYKDTAAALMRWVVANTADPQGPGGFTGGVHGFDDTPVRIGWKSTEHNVDLVAAFGWMARLDPAGGWDKHAAAARAFVDAMFRPGTGHFLTGTLPDGVTPNGRTSGLDAQLWPLLLEGAPAAWAPALAYAVKAHGAEGGLDFNDDRDGLWVEGTAQGALSAKAVGQPDLAARFLAEVAREWSPGGYLWATRRPSITTGLAIGPDSTTADFLYYRHPHLGATAWAVLAATGWNPFTGKRVK